MLITHSHVRRQYYQTHHAPRIVVFWLVSVVSTTVVITVIATDWITWDRLNRDFFATSELSRAFLASFVLVMDLMIVMQDWDFPHFTSTLDVNLPGFHKHTVKFHAVEIEISGKFSLLKCVNHLIALRLIKTARNFY